MSGFAPYAEIALTWVILTSEMPQRVRSAGIPCSRRNTTLRSHRIGLTCGATREAGSNPHDLQDPPAFLPREEGEEAVMDVMDVIYKLARQSDYFTMRLHEKVKRNGELDARTVK